MTVNVQDFFRDHCAAGGLILVRAIKTQGEVLERMAIFTGYGPAIAWGDSLGEEWKCIYSPYIADEPDWDETPRKAMQ